LFLETKGKKRKLGNKLAPGGRKGGRGRGGEDRGSGLDASAFGKGLVQEQGGGGRKRCWKENLGRHEAGEKGKAEL